MSRVYICHTFYHAYIACVKELLLRGKEPSADLLLSTMSNDFGELPERLRKTGLFREVHLFDEQSGADNPKLQELRKDRGNLFRNLIQRIRYTRWLGELQEPHIPVDLHTYDEVNVFCDSDPVGYYLNRKKIPYHALEDGLNCDKLDDMARLSNTGTFRLKAILARLGLIFIPNGYSRYCLDYEVNDLSVNPFFAVPEGFFSEPVHEENNIASRPRGWGRRVIVVPRRELCDRLTDGDHALLAELFLPDAEELRSFMRKKTRPVAMILTEPLCAPDVRARLFGDIVERYRADHDVIIKPHPRDLLDYEKLFGTPDEQGISVLTGRFPMEALDDLAEFRIAKLVSVITQVDDVRFADEMVYLGMDFLDRYEDPAVHRKMERLTGRKTESSSVRERPATPADRDWWLLVRNDEEARRHSTNSGVIDPETHARWFADKLIDDNERLFVFLKGEERVGQLRLTKCRIHDKAAVEISYAVAPGARGQGVGHTILERAKVLSADTFPGLALFGEVMEGNKASLHLFRTCGFTEASRENGMIRFLK
ncbi:MAG: GNAT family N-acetyltransferase [Lachnospiraceae bacterium]|nr:GNAT family N-acetyltransferase [Lachnospiraceae bacterium]